MKHFIGKLKFFLMWLLFLVILPFGLVAVGLILLGLLLSLILPEKQENKVGEFLCWYLYEIISSAGHYVDAMDRCIVKN